ncbi:MAG: isoamylase early set domain-containing protein [Desulfobacterales bacterium]|nr:MAG: isoamylase early set domain-containing protein [Desulfobacterales bacterium]UCG79787.1 MAG: isoamylase early set domain-containing protein [Desulfobacterales bacterium]
MRQKKTKKAKPKKDVDSVITHTRKKSASRTKNAANTGIKKAYLTSRSGCRVTFSLPRIAAPDAETVSVVGEFNGWDIHATPMKKLKNGDFTITVDLQPGREYQFRYLIDDSVWENDWNADRYVRSPYEDSDNSVVLV